MRHSSAGTNTPLPFSITVAYRNSLIPLPCKCFHSESIHFLHLCNWISHPFTSLSERFSPVTISSLHFPVCPSLMYNSYENKKIYYFKTNFSLSSIFNHTYVPITLLTVTVTYLERAKCLLLCTHFFSSVHFILSLPFLKQLLPGCY